MKFMFLFSLLFFSVHAFNLEKTVYKNVNNDIDPCDDFYQHATSSMSFSMRNYYEELVRVDYDLFNTDRTLSNMMLNKTGLIDTPSKSNYTEKISQICGGDQGILSQLLLRQFDDKFLCESYIKRGLPQAYSVNDLKGFSRTMRVIEDNKQIYDVIKDKNCHFPSRKIQKLTEKLIKLVIDEVSNTEWLKHHNFTDGVLDRLKTIGYYDIVAECKKSHDYHENVPEYLNECLKDLDSNNLYDVLFCRMIIIYPFQNFIYSSPSYANFQAEFREDNKLVYYPAFNIMAKQDNIAAKLSTGMIILHELGHTVYSDILIRLNKNESNAIKCVRNEMDSVCRLFIKNDTDYCDKKITIGEDMADFSMIMLLNKFANLLFEEEESFFDRKTAKILFYSYARIDGYINTYSSRSSHSFIGDRINMIARQSHLFTKAFQCKQGDRMVPTKEEKCFLSGPHAPITKSQKNSELREYFFTKQEEEDDQQDC